MVVSHFILIKKFVEFHRFIEKLKIQGTGYFEVLSDLLEMSLLLGAVETKQKLVGEFFERNVLTLLAKGGKVKIKSVILAFSGETHLHIHRLLMQIANVTIDQPWDALFPVFVLDGSNIVSLYKLITRILNCIIIHENTEVGQK